MAAKRARAAEAKVIKKGASGPAKAAPKAAAKTAPKIAAKKAKPAPKAKAAPKAAKPAPKKAAKAEPKKAAKTEPKTAKAAKAEPKTAKAAKAASGLRAGDAVPAVELADHEGKSFSLGDLQGESYVLYFYPKDDTPGCTREACAFRDDLGKFERAKVRIIGVSPDKPESHTRFRTKYGLPFTLLSDVDKVAANAFGVWVKKQNYGREYMGIERSTFLVDESGKIKKVWHNVKVDGHAEAVLAAAE